MNQLFANKPTENHNSLCAQMMSMGERELAALLSAVRELFGSEQARLSAEDWLQELAGINAVPGSVHAWRHITLLAISRLAQRVNGFRAVEWERRAEAEADTKVLPIASSNCFGSTFLV